MWRLLACLLVSSDFLCWLPGAFVWVRAAKQWMRQRISSMLVVFLVRVPCLAAF